MRPTAGPTQAFAVALTVVIAVVLMPAPASGTTAIVGVEQPSAAPLLRSALARQDSSSTPRRVTLLNTRPPWVDDAPHPPSHRDWPFAADPRRWPRLFTNTTECTLSFDPVLRRHRWQL
jgi:hypothetical protein